MTRPAFAAQGILAILVTTVVSGTQSEGFPSKVGDSGIWSVEVATGAHRQVVPHGSACIAPSPDGKRVAALSREPTESQPPYDSAYFLYVGSIGGPYRRLWEMPHRTFFGDPGAHEGGVCWSPDGRYIGLLAWSGLVLVNMEGKHRIVGPILAPHVREPPAHPPKPDPLANLDFRSARWVGHGAGKFVVTKTVYKYKPDNPVHIEEKWLVALDVLKRTASPLCRLPSTGSGSLPTFDIDRALSTAVITCLGPMPDRTALPGDPSTREWQRKAAALEAERGGLWLWRRGERKLTHLLRGRMFSRPALSPNGRHVAITAPGSQPHSGATILCDTTTGKVVWKGSDQERAPRDYRFDRSGERLCFVAATSIAVTPIDRWQPRTVIEKRKYRGQPKEPMWTPDGKHILFRVRGSKSIRIPIWRGHLRPR